MALKTCFKCRLPKPTDEYHKCRKNPDGLKLYCRFCDIVRQSEYRSRKGTVPRRIRPTEPIPSGYRRCLDCMGVKDEASFCKSSRGKNGLAAYCRACQSKRVTRDRHKHKENVRKWRVKNREKYLVQHAANQLRRRAKKHNQDTGTVTTSVIRKLLENNICSYCGVETSDKTIDHVIPLSRGGPHDVGNLVMCCRPCNSSKRDKLPEEWNEFQGQGVTRLDQS